MEKQGLENKRHRETEPDFSKKGFRWRFPLGPVKTLLTVLCISILALSLSADAAWLIGYQYMIYLLYIGAFSTTLMLMIDISSIIAYWKTHRTQKQEERTVKDLDAKRISSEYEPAEHEAVDCGTEDHTGL